MRLIVYIIISLSFYNLTLQQSIDAKIINIQSEEFKLALFDECFPDPTNTRIHIINWTNHIHDYFRIKNLKPIVLFGIEKTDNLEMYESIQQRYLIYTNETTLPIKPLPAKLIIADELNINTFKLVLYKLKNSIFWNIQGFLLIKNINVLDSCKNAYIFLQITWRFNILSAVYLCRDLKFGLKLYTHNPYSKNASKFWIKNATYVEENGELFTLFVNAEQEVDRSLMCQEIWFDKTQDLSEYPVRVALSNLTYDSTIDESTGKFVKVEAYKTGRQYMSIIWNKLNARMYSVEYFLEEDFGEIDGDGIASGIIGDVLQGKFEALGSEDYQRGLWKLEVNTFLRSGLCFIIKKVHLSISEQLMKVFPVRIQLTLLIVFIMISVIFSYLLKRSFSTIVMDVIRAFIGVSMIYKPRATFGKIIIWFIFAFMILNSFLQSQLSAMLATDTSYRDPETDIYDLLNMGYDIRINSVIEEAYRHFPFPSKNHFFDNLLECLRLMKTNNMIACIEDCTLIKYVMQQSEEVDILYDKDYDRNDVLIMRDETPLHNRVEKIYSRLFEHGIIWYINDLDRLYYKRTGVTKVMGLSMERLRYSIYVLILGYSFSILTFLFEIGTFKIKSLYFTE